MLGLGWGPTRVIGIPVSCIHIGELSVHSRLPIQSGWDRLVTLTKNPNPAGGSSRSGVFSEGN